MEPDTRSGGQLGQLLRIKKARETAARRALDAALDIERKRHAVRDNAAAFRDDCAAEADSYFRNRFKDKTAMRDFRHFFESVAHGNLKAQRAMSRATAALRRASQRYDNAITEREAAAKDLLSKSRSVETLERLMGEQERAWDTKNEIVEEDDLSEIQAARREHAVL